MKKHDIKQGEVRSEVLRLMREKVGAHCTYECKTPAGHDLLWFVVGGRPAVIQVYPEGQGWCEYIAPAHNDRAKSIADMKAMQDAVMKGHYGTQA